MTNIVDRVCKPLLNLSIDEKLKHLQVNPLYSGNP